MSALLSPEVAKQAVDLVLPSILSMMKTGRTSRTDLHIVILDPAYTADEIKSGKTMKFQDFIVYQLSLGNVGTWEWDYVKIAKSKARLAWRTQMNTSAPQQLYPQRYRGEDTKHAGGVWFNWIVVACSGVQSYFDEMFATWIAAACQALCVEQMQLRVLADGNTDYLYESLPERYSK